MLIITMQLITIVSHLWLTVLFSTVYVGPVTSKEFTWLKLPMTDILVGNSTRTTLLSGIVY